MGARVDPDLARRLDDRDEEPLNVILKASEGIDELVSALPTSVEIRHRYRLLDSVAATADADVLRRVLDLSAVESMELDHSVTAYEEDP